MKTTMRIQPTASHEAAAEELVDALGRAAGAAARVEAERLRFALACYRSQLRAKDRSERLQRTRIEVAEAVLAHHVNRARKTADELESGDELSQTAA
jgi:hypothetical protein